MLSSFEIHCECLHDGITLQSKPQPRVILCNSAVKVNIQFYQNVSEKKSVSGAKSIHHLYEKRKRGIKLTNFLFSLPLLTRVGFPSTAVPGL